MTDYSINKSKSMLVPMEVDQHRQKGLSGGRNDGTGWGSGSLGLSISFTPFSIRETIGYLLHLEWLGWGGLVKLRSFIRDSSNGRSGLGSGDLLVLLLSLGSGRTVPLSSNLVDERGEPCGKPSVGFDSLGWLDVSFAEK